MDVVFVLVAFSTLWKLSSSIQCYMCVPERLYDAMKTPVCEDFDKGERLVVDCPYSTMCLKKETLLDSLGVATKSFQRGCALQTMDGDQHKVGRHYEYVKNIYEVYKEGCEEDNNADKLTKTTHCYCRGDLCNDTGRVTAGYFSSIFVVGLVIWTLI